MGTEGFLWKGCEISIGMEGYKRVQKDDDHSSEYSWLAITTNWTQECSSKKCSLNSWYYSRLQEDLLLCNDLVCCYFPSELN